MRRACTTIALVFAYACNHTVLLVELGDAGCDGAACLPDAGSVDHDSGPLPLGSSRFGAADSSASFRTLASALEGPFVGTAESAEGVARFELTFIPAREPAGAGAFRMRCVGDVLCEPFGPGTGVFSHEGRYALITTTRHHGGVGELVLDAAPGSVGAPFWDMSYDTEREELSFALGHLGLARQAGVHAQVRLTRGSTRAAPGADASAGEP